jgi:hypothetical protein
MKTLSETVDRSKLWCIALIIFFGWLPNAFANETTGAVTQQESLPSWVHLETDGIFVYYKPQEVETYRRLLPTTFEMPETPLVHVYVDDFYKMTAGSDPYREAAVFLLGKYNGEDIWWCVTMPVTSEAARMLGANLGGWPKTMADISLRRNDPDFSATMKVDGRQVLDLRLQTGQHKVTDNENQWFEKLHGIRKVTLLRGKLKVHDERAGRFSLFDLTRFSSDKMTVKVGTAHISFMPGTATEANIGLTAFGIKPAEIVLAYYFRNKFHWSLLHPDVPR